MAERVRSTNDGQVGFVVTGEDGQKWVRLDRPTGIGSEGRQVLWKEGEWKPAPQDPLPPMSVARICYEADKALRHARGEYTIPDWQSVYDRPEGRAWMKGPPAGVDEARQRLDAAIRKALTE